MTSFKIAHSHDGDWSRIAKSLAEDLGGGDSLPIDRTWDMRQAIFLDSAYLFAE